MMNKVALDNAIRFGQLLLLLNPIGSAHKPTVRRVSSLRSRLDEQLVLVKFGTPEVSDAAQGKISEMTTALVASLKQFMDVPKFVELCAGRREVYPADVMQGRRRTHIDSLFSEVESIEVSTSQTMNVSDAERAGLLSGFGSAVRNSDWHATLLMLGVNLATVTQSILQLSAHGSRQGKEQLPALLEKICPGYQSGKSTKPARGRRKVQVQVAEGMFTTHVTCQVDALLAHPDISALAYRTHQGYDVEPSLASLLSIATQPVTVKPGETAEAAAQSIINDLVAGLLTREKALDAQKKLLLKQAEVTAKTSAVEALRGLSPKLLAVLKKNPDLLAKA